MKKATPLSHKRFISHGRYDKKVDSTNGLNLLSPDKQKVCSAIRMRAMKIQDKINKVGIV